MPNIKYSKENHTIRYFHNQKVLTYNTYVSFYDINPWSKNFRTLLSFEELQEKEGKKLENIERGTILKFIFNNDDLKLADLADSISEAGLKSSIIIKEDGILLDGNRRYFACALLNQRLSDNYYKDSKKREKILDILKALPAIVIPNKGYSEQIQIKIIAEMNYISDHRIQWPVGVRAKMVYSFYEEILKEKNLTKKEAVLHIAETFGEEKGTIESYIATIELINNYIKKYKSKDSSNEFALRRTGEEQFVYFWEYVNKAIKGTGKLTENDELEVRNLFFELMNDGKALRNMKEVEPVIKSIKNQKLWGRIKEMEYPILVKEAVIDFNETKFRRSIKNKIASFRDWIEQNLTKDTVIKEKVSNDIKSIIKILSDLIK
ncbi:ParB N-terminal domain-containing protein [Leptospira licerasiae]|uniref:ParB N-terminal domain-containing protein n=1 Tax=Leptospira licerasiae TaxID=447106 RepID=UPI001083AA42|nr:ParB N-terminal domain-containing protein [Leptospira licerasiae]TGM87905.1 hypothetical protein EHR05_14715 [Leptospira licerasiae]